MNIGTQLKSKEQITSFGLNLLIMAALTGVVFLYDLESDLKLFELMVVVIGGYLTNALLPLKWRNHFLLLLSFTSLFVFYEPVVACLSIVLGIAILAIADSPVSTSIKKVLLLLIGLGMVVVTQTPSIPNEFRQVVSLVGILFMFRLISYLYERQIDPSDETSYVHRLSYFYILPNFAFYIFPIIDYKTYAQKYQVADEMDLRRKGVIWMSAGILQLLIYRLIYYYLVPAPSEIESLFVLFQYLIYSYLLILRLIGLFELSVGIMCIFGFDMPRVFKNIFLADGFNDIWRRINTYYREFIMKIVYYPVYFKLKKYLKSAVVITVLIVFVFNWFFHAYQWFWILKVFPIKVTDIGFWSIFAVLVAAGSWMQKNRKKKPSGISEWMKSVIQAVKVVGMFMLMCLLWAFWTSEDLVEFVGLWSFSTEHVLRDSIFILGLISLTILFLGMLYHWDKRSGKISAWDVLSPKKRNVLGFTSVFLFLAGLGPVRDLVQSYVERDLSGIYESRLNKYDEEKQFKGYYESLIVPTSITSRMWEVDEEEDNVRVKANLKSLGLFEKSEIPFEKKFRPNSSSIFKGKPFTINEHGIRDRLNYYPFEKPKGTLRIALLGGSIELGSGVADHETFENLLENRLNKEPIWSEISKVEIMNFAMSATHLPHHVYRAKYQVQKFEPNLVIYTAHLGEIGRSLDVFSKVLFSNSGRLFPKLDKLADSIALDGIDNKSRSIVRLKPYENKLYEWGMNALDSIFPSDEVVKLWVSIPVLRRRRDEDHDTTVKIAEKNSFHTLDLRQAFDGIPFKELKVSQWDGHPNARGHQLISDALYETFSSDRVLDSLVTEMFILKE